MIARVLADLLAGRQAYGHSFAAALPARSADARTAFIRLSLLHLYDALVERSPASPLGPTRRASTWRPDFTSPTVARFVLGFSLTNLPSVTRARAAIS